MTVCRSTTQGGSFDINPERPWGGRGVYRTLKGDTNLIKSFNSRGKGGGWAKGGGEKGRDHNTGMVSPTREGRIGEGGKGREIQRPQTIP